MWAHRVSGNEISIVEVFLVILQSATALTKPSYLIKALHPSSTRRSLLHTGVRWTWPYL